MNKMTDKEEMTDEEKRLATPTCARHSSPIKNSVAQPACERTSLNMRAARISRATAETQIELRLNLDGKGKCNLDCPIGFLTHMLSAFCKHGMFDLEGVLRRFRC